MNNEFDFDPDSVLIAKDSFLDAPSRSHELKIMQASVESARTRLALFVDGDWSGCIYEIQVHVVIPM